MKINLINCLIALKNASLFNKKSITIKSNNQILKLIESLYKEAFILTFYLLKDSTKLKIILKHYTALNFFATLKILTKSSLNFYIKYLDLSKLIFKHKIVFISTTEGILTGKECKKKKLGGTVLFIS